MVSDKTDLSSRSLLLTSVVILALVTIVAVITRLWVLTAIPIGFLFGFFLGKGRPMRCFGIQRSNFDEGFA